MKKYILMCLPLVAIAYGCNNSSAASNLETNAPITAVENPGAAIVSLPAFKIVDLKGKPINLLDFKGKRVFVNLWASWCPPCRAEIPSIEGLYRKLDKSKVVFVMLSVDNDFATAVNFATKNKLTTPVYYPAETMPALFNVQGIPATFIFDEKGNLIKRMDGSDDYDTKEYLKLFSN
jgi:thiol-disulfide isomerase/thioredoxin